ncbi:MAG TPA: ABC transporter permease [Bacteroidia bacterium]|nr:ABC transporter permease [Bacteroidia bacterium]
MSDNAESWDLIISSRRSLFRLGVKDLWRYRDLLFLFVRRDFVAFYKQTALGPVWFFLQPLFTMLVYILVFGKMAGISTDGLPRPLFYLAGITAWSYFSECLIKTSTVFKDNAAMFGKIYFPRLVVPFSIVISNLVRFGVQVLLLLLFMLYYSLQGALVSVSWNLIWFPVMVILMAMQGLGLGMIVSALTTRYRDLALLLNFGVQLLMFSTTVVYPLSSLSGKFYSIVSLNPLTHIMEGVRYSLFGAGTCTFSGMLYAFTASVVLLLVGIFMFNRVEKNFVDTI